MLHVLIEKYIQQNIQLTFISKTIKSHTMWRDLKNSIKKIIESAELKKEKNETKPTTAGVKEKWIIVLLTGKHSFTIKYIKGAQFSL